MKIGILTTSRADYGIYQPLLKALEKDSFFDLTVIALGMHVEKKFGRTIESIKSDNFKVIELNKTLSEGDSSSDTAISIGETCKEVAKFYKSSKMDLIFALGDRYEMFAAVSAIIPHLTPIAHFHGGEVTYGSFDDKFRHAITQLSDLHFTSCEKYRKRIIQMGFPASHAHNIGSLALHNIKKEDLYGKDEILKKYGIDFNQDVFLVTFHPVTNEIQDTEYHINELLSFLRKLKGIIVFTGSNADPKSQYIRSQIEKFSKKEKNIFIYENLGAKRYFSFMHHCKMMIGNTSSGIIEAASFGTVVINVGNRQKGREISKNVFNSGYAQKEIAKTFNDAVEAIGKEFNNIYFQKNSVTKVVEVLKNIDLAMITKNRRFNDLN